MPEATAEQIHISQPFAGLKGTNTMRLNTIEITTAVQEYLDRRWVSSPGNVTNIIELNSSSAKCFEITLSEHKPGEA